MTLFRSSFAIGLILALNACVMPDKPTVTDYQGMVPLGYVIGAGLWPLAGSGEIPLFAPRQLGARYHTHSARGSFIARGVEECRVRLLINADGKVTRASFLEGSRTAWVTCQTKFKYWEFDVSPDALPGPWELDVAVVLGPPGHSYYHTKHISYRSLGAA